MKQRIHPMEQRINHLQIDLKRLKALFARNQEFNHMLHAERCKCVEEGRFFNRRKDLRESAQEAQNLARQIEAAQRKLSNTLAQCG